MTNRLGLLCVLPGVLAVMGCGSISGLDAEDKFACSAPAGVTCMSVSGIYANAKAKNLPGQRVHDDAPGAPATTAPVTSTERVVERNYNSPDTRGTYQVAGQTSPRAMSAPSSGPPLRTPERILRVWLAPFEDQEGDLHDQKYFYVTVNTGSWTIEANRVNIRQQFMQVTPLSKGNPANREAEPGQRLTPQQQAAQMMPTSPVPQQAGEDE